MSVKFFLHYYHTGVAHWCQELLTFRAKKQTPQRLLYYEGNYSASVCRTSLISALMQMDWSAMDGGQTASFSVTQA